MTTEYDDQLKQLGQRIINYRKQRNMTQVELAAELGISAAHLSSIECGHSNCSISIFMKLTEVLQVSADELLRTNVPKVEAIHNAEISGILEGCTAQEAATLIKVMREIKETLRNAKDEK